MSELGSLFLVVLLVYLIQCICWVGPGAVVFALEVRARGKRRQQGFVWNALETAGLLANPLPPLAPLVVVQWPAFQLTPDSIQLPGTDDRTIVIPWEKLAVTHSDSKLLANGSTAFKGSEEQVLQYVALLQRVQSARRAQRGEIIRNWLQKMFSTQTAVRRVLLFTYKSRWLRIFSNIQFFFLFVLVPLGFRWFGLAILWRVALMLAVISICITLEFWTLHKTFFPEAKGVRMKLGMTALLSPMAAIRACDAAARDLLSGFHPVAAAGAILRPDDFRRFAAEQLRLCRFAVDSNQWYQENLRNLMEKAINQKGLKPEELLRPPQQESGCIVYCPRCHAQYTRERTECTDCGYETLAPFDAVAVQTKP
jgi:hypothetical protein